MGIGINFSKAKEIAHEKRRIARSLEFSPLDIKVTIPAESADAEAKRQLIRDRYTDIQTRIDQSQTVEELKLIVNEFSDTFK